MFNYAIRVYLPILLPLVLCGWLGCAHRNASSNMPKSAPYLFRAKPSQAPEQHEHIQNAQPRRQQPVAPQSYDQYGPQKVTSPYLFQGKKRTNSSIRQVSANVPYEVSGGPQSVGEFFDHGFSGRHNDNDGGNFLNDLQFSFAHPPQRNVNPSQQIIHENMVPQIPSQRYAQQYPQHSDAEQYPWDQGQWNPNDWNAQPSWAQNFWDKLPWSRRSRELRAQQYTQSEPQQPLPEPYQRRFLLTDGIGDTARKLHPTTVKENVTGSKFVNAISSEYKPLKNRNWIPNHSRQATAEIGEGSNADKVSIRNIRNTTYRTATDYKTSYYDATFSLSELQSLYLIEIPFKGMPSVAHVEVSFGFADGTYLGLSVEARYERGESYDPLGGLFNQFELIYVIANEQDMIRINTDVNGNDVYLYRLNLTQEEIRAIFVDAMHRANKLSLEPEFYHTLKNNCASNIIDHINRVRPKAIPFEYRAVFPGYLDHLLYDLNLVDAKESSFQETRQKAKINDLAQKFHHSEFFSAGIRQNLY